MRVLRIQHGTEWYTVNEQGHIARPGLVAGSDSWVFLGFSFHHWRRGIDVTLAQIFANPNVLKGKTLWGWDRDHGHLRAWGHPRTHRAYVDTI